MIRDMTSASQCWIPESWRLWRHVPLAALSYGPRSSVDLRRVIPPGLGRRRIRLPWFGWGGGSAPPLARITTMLAWSYLALVLLMLILVRVAGDRWWVATLLTFGPRWIVLVPFPPLISLALLVRRKALISLAIAGLILVGPVMGFNVPWASLFAGSPDSSFTLRAVTLNIGGGVDTAALVHFLKDYDPDVVAFQESGRKSDFPAELGKDWHLAVFGGLLVASRYPIVAMTPSEAVEGRYTVPAVRCDLATPAGKISVYCVHLFTLREGLEAIRWRLWRGADDLQRVTERRNEESAIVARFARRSDAPSIVLGDFNLTGDSAIFRRDWGLWRDAFRNSGTGFGYTFASSRIGLRIDHILADRSNWHVEMCFAGPDVSGQHRPVSAELVLLRNGD